MERPDRARLQPVVVEDAQRPKAHLLRIAVLVEREVPARMEPAALLGMDLRVAPELDRHDHNATRSMVAHATSNPVAMKEPMTTVDYNEFTRHLMDDIRQHGGPTSGPMAGRPLMILTTSGAKSGEPRSAVVTYTRDGDRYVIAASKSGAPTNPQWFYNIKANPDVTVEAEGQKFNARATVTSRAERDRLWAQHAEERPEFREYPKKTDRVIPMILLDRLD